MKKIIVFAALVVLFASCKKSDSGNIVAPNTITATIGGTNYLFNQRGGSSIAVYQPNGQYFSIFENDSLSNSLNIFASSYASNFSLSSYTSALGSTNGLGNFRFSLANDTTQYAGSIQNPIVITLTAVTSTSIQGTFQGIIYANADTSKISKVVTNGKFNLVL
jgi:hypothetical protein